MPKDSKYNVSIIIVSYKNSHILKLCLDSILKNVSAGLTYEIIVVDSEARDEIKDLVTQGYQDIIYIPIKENVGLAKALNIGIKKAKGETILSLNPDIIVQKESIEKLYDYAIGHTKMGIAGPRLLNFNGTDQASCFSFYTPLTVIYRRTLLGRLFFAKKTLKKFIIDVSGDNPRSIKGWLMGSALMLRRDNLEKVGLMDERYFMYFEDVDWCRRFWEAGYDIVHIPNAKMFHYHSKTSASQSVFSVFFNKFALIHFLSGLKYFVKFKGWRVKRVSKK